MIPTARENDGGGASSLILVIDDDDTLRRLLQRQIERLGHGAAGASSMAEARAFLETERADLILLDQRLPDADGLAALPELMTLAPVIVLTAFGSIDQAVDAVKAGAADYLPKPISPQALELAIARVFETVRLRGEVGLLRRALDKRPTTALIGTSPQIETLRQRAGLLAETDTPVLILGEWGTGKRTIARYIHEHGPRARANFVEVQCARKDADGLLSELFGDTEPGLLESAAGGTLFLADIARMPDVVQRRLAGALETGAFSRRGSTRRVPLQVRLIAASAQPAVEVSGEDGLVPELFYSLSGFTLEVPPLRERRGDIPELAQDFLAERSFASDREKQFTKKTLKHLQEWTWPGNLRELRNVIERGVILSGDAKTIPPRHVEPGASRAAAPSAEEALPVSDEPSLEALELRYLDMLLRKHQGNRREVARILGISERSVYRMLARRRDD